MLDPQAAQLLKLLQDNRVPPVNTQTVAQAREAYRARRNFSQPEPSAVGRVADHVVSANGARFAVREYQPPGRSTSPLPALVYFHGGGWTIGDLDTHDVLCRSLCVQTGMVVVAVDYRMGPEHRFPAAYQDSLAAYAWTLGQATALGIDPGRIAVGGDSAGGNLAAAACIGLRGSEQPPAFQLLIYPATHMDPVTESHRVNGQGYLLTREAIEWFVGQYLSGPQDAKDWRASPLLASSHADLPPALVLTAGFDPLRDEGLQYANALSAAGVPCQYVCFERQIHGFISMGRLLTEANTAVSLCAQALRQVMSI
ncbi:MAG: alpha/beta hydrolase [Alphaproteobacteria bacterium]|nr:alpha/beta hydrolase [Alphaproteobacteria bacterium]